MRRVCGGVVHGQTPCGGKYKWPPKLQREITFKELFAVIIATAVWGPS